MNPLYGWLIYNGNLKTDKFIDYVRWFQKVAKEHDVYVDAIANNELLVTIERSGEASFTSKKVDMSRKRPDFVHFADKDLHLARHLENAGIPVFNSSSAIELCDNKAYMHQVLSSKHIPMPKTIISPKVYPGLPLTDESHVEMIKETLNFPLILKEAYGSFGQQVYWINNEKELIQKVTELKGRELVFQEPVMTSLGTDIRLNVVGERVVAAMKRTSETDFRANVTAGGKTIRYKPTANEEALAIASAKAVGAVFAGVDLLIGEDGPVLCEVNSNPHLRSIYECTGVDVAVEMVEFIKVACRKGE
ncbi:ATP-grasp domain-containing protein [Evansella cellulosilytica]|uniref:Alpha-L-glutamate ligase, RimK family n=1 Tax=Evansella cellulosilytica (strain ATCC 21833 / DSM 2522 / FERM P-1141 / JCM 9156 / N-4) TaxID=649639 RepID=E6TZP6_EVAC2|nr:RimK family alpha-L-glutamate ligase [Evansella cellulosilytica]ADU31352.1 alpha-L-glutamate ligase, RimK family [Evansella cellulosilytica DSM 2522]